MRFAVFLSFKRGLTTKRIMINPAVHHKKHWEFDYPIKAPLEGPRMSPEATNMPTAKGLLATQAIAIGWWERVHAQSSTLTHRAILFFALLSTNEPWRSMSAHA